MSLGASAILLRRGRQRVSDEIGAGNGMATRLRTILVHGENRGG